MIGVAVVGLGAAARPHALSLLDLHEQVEVRWAASRSTARTEAFAAEFPFPVTNDVERAICDPAVDAVFLLTPPSSHLDLALQAFARGKHVLVEKPLDASLERASAMVETAETAGLRLGVVLQHRFRPGAQQLGDLLRAGDLGDVQAAHLEVPWWRPQAYYDESGRGTFARDGGGVLMTQAIHSLDLFRSLIGPVEVEAAMSRTTALHRMEAEDYVAALLRLTGGGVGSIRATTAQFPGRAERIEVIGSRGVATLTGGGLEVRWLDGSARSLPDSGGTGSGEIPMGFAHHDHRRLIADFCAAVEGGRAPAASGREALATQRLIAEILETAGAATSRGATTPHNPIYEVAS